MSKDEVDFEETRRTADEKLKGRLDAIRSGEDIDALSTYAKAYLGMFLEIESTLPPEARLRKVANDAVADAVLTGFEKVLSREDLSTPDEIGAALSRDRRDSIGYVVLAGMSRVAEHSAAQVITLPETTLRSALCFRYTHTPNQETAWERMLLTQYPQIAVPALLQFWFALLRNANYLPGLAQILEREDTAPVVAQVILPILRAWTQCRRAYLAPLLHAALRYTDHTQLLQVARQSLARHDTQDVARRTYWLATAFMLDPDEFSQILTDYIGRSRDKVLPLLDFVSTALSDAPGKQIQLPPMALAQLLRIIAPQLRRNVHDMGGLDATSQKVLNLFDRLGADRSEEAGRALAMLRKVRVMRKYSDVLDRVGEMQGRGQG